MSTRTPQVLNDLVVEARRVFEQRFDQQATWVAAAPGRVNLIGEHTDYNGGFVLPMAINRWTLLAAGDSASDSATIYSALMEQTATFSVTNFESPSDALGERCWSEYIRGVVAGCRDHALFATGFNAIVLSNVPSGGGLSSSAAIEAATATLVEAMTGRRLEGVEKALLCQQAEHRYAGVPCGIMDPFASVLAKEGHLLRIDCRTQAVEHVSFGADEVAILIVNSNVRHSLADSEYAKRREECFEAADLLGIPSLRDATHNGVLKAKEQLGPVRFRRARHIVTENERVLDAVKAIRDSDWPAVGQLMIASHASLRDDYEVSCRELDVLVEIASELGQEAGVYGARMTGGGFGGCIVCLARKEVVDKVADQLSARYKDSTGITPSSFSSRPVGGARIV